MMIRCVLLCVLALLTACQAGQATEPAESEADLVHCGEPRPEICTMDYRPVCAQRRDGSERTYSNGCTACSDPQVLAWRAGSCEGSDGSSAGRRLE